MRKISSVVADPSFTWPRIAADPQKGTPGNYMPLEQALSRHLGLPTTHLVQELHGVLDYVNVQGQPFNHPGLSGPQLNQYTAHNKLALRVCDACDYYYAQLGWPKEHVARLLAQAGL